MKNKKNGIKKQKNNALAAIAVIIIVLFIFYFFYNYNNENIKKIELEPINEQKNTKTIELPPGRVVYYIQSSHNSPNIYEAAIDPLKVSVGDTQKMTLKIKDNAFQIASVIAAVETDNGIKRYGLKLIEGTANDGVWKSSWIVHDTHEKTYRTTFTAVNSNNEESSVTLTWSDPCGIPVKGNWFIDSTISATSCYISGVNGVEEGDVVINKIGYTITIGGGAVFVYNPGRGVRFGGGNIAIEQTGQLKQSYLWMVDADRDGYGIDANGDGVPDQYISDSPTTSPVANGRRRTEMLSIDTPDMNDNQGMCDGIPCTISVLDSAGNVGKGASISGVKSGDTSYIYISYFDDNNGRLKFAKSSTGGARCTIQTINDPTLGRYGTYSSISSSGNSVNIAYFHENTQTLSKTRSLDYGSDTSWIPSSLHDSYNPVVQYVKSVSSSAVSHNPFYSYYDRGGGIDKVIFYNSFTNSRVQLCSYCSMSSIDSLLFPDYVFVVSPISSMLLFYRFRSDGTSIEGYRASSDPSAKVDRDSIDVIDSDTAYIAYHYNNQLKYVKATGITNFGGLSFTNGIIDSTSGAGLYHSIHASQNAVYVAYYDSTNKDLKLALSTDSGATWTIKTLDTEGDVGQYASLYVLGDNAYIAYYDATNQDLKFMKVYWPAPTTTTTTTPTTTSSNCLAYYRDIDGDGYGAGIWADGSASQSIAGYYCDSGATCPSGYSCVTSSTPPQGYTSEVGDCNDNEPRAKPGQASYFYISFTNNIWPSKSYDWNCDGSHDKSPDWSNTDCTASGSGCLFLTGNSWSSGWVGSIPSCGQSSTWQYFERDMQGLCVGGSGDIGFSACETGYYNTRAIAKQRARGPISCR